MRDNPIELGIFSPGDGGYHENLSAPAESVQDASSSMLQLGQHAWAVVLWTVARINQAVPQPLTRVDGFELSHAWSRSHSAWSLCAIKRSSWTLELCMMSAAQNVHVCTVQVIQSTCRQGD